MPLMAQKTTAWRQEHCKKISKLPFELVAPNAAPKPPFLHEESSLFFVVFYAFLSQHRQAFSVWISRVTAGTPGQGGLFVFCLARVPFTHRVQNSPLSMAMTVFALCSLSFEYVLYAFPEATHWTSLTRIPQSLALTRLHIVL